MASNASHGTAKIYQFPVRGRKTAGGDHEPIRPTTDPRFQPVLGDTFGSGWYHDAAIEEEKRRPSEH
ncbi:DUF2735 domain-containing protein [Bradyrhizobium sp. SYSU BS000235]|uniref:DUF2735 domain-containing protein n=1 Tax=Bradyrhizobium sp. SYSU BS000235 TaxID=3411332 RepID=UPI003C756775